jgi:hypothetical protein
MSVLEKMFCAMEMDIAPPRELKKIAIASDGVISWSLRIENGLRTSRWHIFLIQNNLDRNKGDLDTGTHSNSGEDLVTNPLGRTRINFQSDKHSSTDGEYRGANPHEWCVGTECSDASANHD